MIQKVISTKLYEQVVEQIKILILSGQYKKGELLPSEKELIKLIGVSRITVREALRILAEVGIIKTHKGKGSIVLVDAQELILKAEGQQYRQNFEMSTNTRLIIEPEIARQAAMLATDKDIKRLEKCLVEDGKEVDNKTSENLLEKFHRCIVKILDNQILLDFFDSLANLEADQYPSVLIPPSRQDTIVLELNKQHKKIFEAIKGHNGEFAYFYMKEHTLFLKDTYIQYFKHFFE